jgi:hypothetical protein
MNADKRGSENEIDDVVEMTGDFENVDSAPKCD